MKRYAQVLGGMVPADGEWVRYEDAQAVIDGLQALLNERDEEIDALRRGGLFPSTVPQGATHFAVERWFKIGADGWFFMNAYNRWQRWTKSPRPGLVPLQVEHSPWFNTALQEQRAFELTAVAIRAAEWGWGARQCQFVEARKYVQHLVDCSRGQGSVATGYLSDILERLQ